MSLGSVIFFVSLVLILTFWLLWRFIVRPYFNAKSARKSSLPKLPRRDFTLQELLEFNGNEGSRILLGVNGKVFDVTENGQHFYGKDGPYTALAGQDASRALACFDVNQCAVKNGYDDLSDLTGEEMNRLLEWENQFMDRYDHVGRLLKPGEPHRVYSSDMEADDGDPAIRQRARLTG